MPILNSRPANKIRDLEAGMIVKRGNQAFIVGKTTEKTADLYPLLPLGTISAAWSYERRVLRQKDLKGKTNRVTIEDARLYAGKYEYVDSEMDVRVAGRD